MRINAGFTLIEVMVAVAIIGILSAIIYPVFSDARDDARNKALMTELKEVQLALEIFKSQKGRYPEIGPFQNNCSDSSNPVHYAQQGGESIKTGGVFCQNFIDYIGDGANVGSVGAFIPEFIDTLPLAEDSGNEDCIFWYQVEDEGNWFKLTAEECFAGAADETEGIQPDSEFARCPNNCRSSGCAGSGSGGAFDTYLGTEDFYESMAVYSSGGECL